MEVRGREIRTTDIDDKSPGYVQATEETNYKKGLLLKPGQQLFISCDNLFMKSNSTRIQCNYRELHKVVKPNDVLYIDDGKIVCLVTDCEHVRLGYYIF